MALSGGTIATGQTICYNGNPAAFTSVADASGGVTGYTYQWQYSTDSGSTWNDISGAGSTTYDSGTLTATRWFRRRVIDSDSPASTGYSNTLVVTVYPVLGAGTIAANQNIFSGQTPALLTSVANASGASGSYVYQWQYSTNGVSYSNIAGATSATYQPPALTQTTYYKRRVYDTFCGISYADYSNVITITVTGAMPVSFGVTVYNVTCNGGSDGYMYATNITGGSGQYEYTIDSGVTWVSGDTFTGLTAGFYDYGARDKNDITNYYIYTNSQVEEPDVITGTIVVGQPTCSGCTDGYINIINITGGHPNFYQASINSGATWQSTSGFDSIGYPSIGAGFYDVMIRSSVYTDCVYYLSGVTLGYTPPPTDLPLPFCLGSHWTASDSTCGNNDGYITIVSNPLFISYMDVYDFTLTDVWGSTYIATASGTFTGLTSGYYFLTATVKPAYWYYYGKETCNFDWIKVEDSDNPAFLVNVSVRPQQCQPFDRQFGRIFYNVSGLTSGSTYSFYAFLSDLTLYYSATGITSTEDFILQNADATCYWVLIRDDVTGCAILIDNRCVPSLNLFSQCVINKLYI